MSIRARRIKNIDYSNNVSFSFSQDEELMGFLEVHGFYDTLIEGSGIAQIDLDALKNAVKMVKLDKETKFQLQKDIKWAEKKKEDYVQYYCF